ncbi:MAG: hypothetical protein RBG13Loki_3682 [Promethearchaeota archaeon CR_4]|nr:MAG: hypothetical protein RBG13Loki_3682 [Candidatus Lokiarchaeota archaeon CR_4]
MPQVVKIFREDPYYNDLNSIFIPFRTVMEMEALVSLYLSVGNYDVIKDIPQSRPSASQFLQTLHMEGNPAYLQIVDFFIKCAMPKLKPVVSYERDHHDVIRRGNVVPYAKTRACLFFALHNLKLKFLVIQEFVDKFRKNQFQLERPKGPAGIEPPSFMTAFGNAFYEKYRAILADMLPKKTVSEKVSRLLQNKDAVTNEKIFQMATNLDKEEEINKIKYIMRNIKASLFVCNLLFAASDLTQAFSRGKPETFNPEETMISQDFIPELVPAITQCLAQNNVAQLRRCVDAFYQLMDIVLDGINIAYNVASGGEVRLGKTETLYHLQPRIHYSPA